jgi:hypothetical protein
MPCLPKINGGVMALKDPEVSGPCPVGFSPITGYPKVLRPSSTIVTQTGLLSTYPPIRPIHWGGVLPLYPAPDTAFSPAVRR